MSSSNTTTRTFVLGAVFLAALGILGYYTLFLTNISWFKKTYDLQVHFEELNGLREGDSVLVAGMRWGRIKSMEFDPEAPIDKRITVICTLEKPLTLREGFTIEIADATLLGGRNLAIDPGPATGKKMPPDQALSGTVAPNPLDALGKLVTESQRGVKDIVDNFAEMAKQARGGKGTIGRLLNDEAVAEDLAQSLKTLSTTLANLDRVTSDLAAGKGTAGMLLTNTEVYDNFARSTKLMEQMLSNAVGITGDIQSGKGALGMLISDPALAEAVVQTLTDLRKIVARVDAGEGTLGMLVRDDTLAKNLTSITGKIERGEGTLGALLVKPDVYENFRSASEDIAVVTNAVRNGRGSLGKLMMDDDLYQQIKTALSIVQRALEEYREAAPITTFTSVFFAAF